MGRREEEGIVGKERGKRTGMRGWEGIETSHPLHQKILDPPLRLLNAKQ